MKQRMKVTIQFETQVHAGFSAEEICQKIVSLSRKIAANFDLLISIGDLPFESFENATSEVSRVEVAGTALPSENGVQS